ncbi:MAG: hypothetical protein HN623_11005, partial [Bdellovibrionales bacterium]|nr:hypothetical protein [Bdellovibrionales bacterium]
MAAKKPENKASTRKLKSKKLEERIAPGMVGGGLVDPGMAESIDTSVDQQADSSEGAVEQTQTEAGTTGSSGTSGGEHLDESADTASYETDGEPAPADGE